jgi:hypothetical protein
VVSKLNRMTNVSQLSPTDHAIHCRHSHNGAQYTDGKHESIFKQNRNCVKVKFSNKSPSGLYGPIVVHNPESEPYTSDYDEEHVLMLSD